MSHKRTVTNAKSPPAKRQSQIAPKKGRPAEAAEPTDQYVYIAAEEWYGGYTDTTPELFEAYATVRDANRRLQAQQETSEHTGDWDDDYDEHGCWRSQVEDGEGQGVKLYVRRLLINPSGSAASRSKKTKEREDPGLF